MNNLINLRTFQITNRIIYEKEDLSYTSFNNLDFFINQNGIIFFRCDFRGSNFSDCNFYKNNLDRSDFISCVFQNVSFKSTQIAASEIKNCYFNNVVFEEKNCYENTSIQECTFVKCKFISESLLVNMKNCTFIDCKFSNCSFERSTTEKLTFVKCTIIDTDLATMHAERHSFKECKLKGVYMGIDYIFGYLFYNTNIKGLSILYHGDEVHLENQKLFESYINNLWKQQRYYEYINANIIYGNFDIIPERLYMALNLLKNKICCIRKLDITDILNSICFYIKNETITYNCFVNIINVLNDFDWNCFSDEEQLTYLVIRNKIDLIINQKKFSKTILNSAYNNISTITFHCKTNDYENAYKYTTNILDKIFSYYGLCNNYIFLYKEKGSWIITFAVCSFIALSLPKFIKCSTDVAIEIKTKKQISKQIENKLNNENLELKDLKLISEIATESNLIPNGDNNYEKIDVQDLINSIKIGL